MKVLLIGLGGFGKNHVEAWSRMGMADSLYVADLRPEAYELLRRYRIPPERFAADHRRFLGQADVVDVVTPSDSHFPLCREALEAGKDVFVEKPVTVRTEEAESLASFVEKTGRILQVGYYYRFHPISRFIKERIDSGALGEIRYMAGNFLGFKRARNDVGVTHTDAIHFLDLFNWFLGKPQCVLASVVRDHFGRGLEDTSLVVLEYPGGAIGRVESGYIQPGRWNDKVVPNAMTTKDLWVMGSKATLVADFEIEEVAVHDVHHELRNGTWTAVRGGGHSPVVGTASPVEQVCFELQAFLESVRTRRPPAAGVVNSGVHLARIMDAIYEASRQRRAVPLDL
ncbi:MAG: Gfo/Idh/MocA family oxidoreductase [Candidatus Tectomicrobia bacterium]|nr:Gfo/Idh/MocA family oxidoreductase [Candidatus Tectomicrobia bacterium]